MQHLDLMSLDPADRKILVGAGITQLVPQTDQAYDLIRDLVKTLNIDLAEAELTTSAGQNDAACSRSFAALSERQARADRLSS